ncbi:MAG: M48 family metallopeptidase [Gemmatimonadaceae bacterium]
MTRQPHTTPDLNALVHPKERTYQTGMLIISVLVYGILGLGLLLVIAQAPGVLGVLFMYVLLGLFMYAMVRGLMLGRIVGNAVRISERQLPQLFSQAREAAGRLGMTTLPDLYLMQSGGMLNAFATRFFGRRFVVLLSEVMDIAGERGEDAAGFVLAHELAHHQRGHLQKHLLFLPGRIIPFLSQAYSRGCELTCDRYGAACYANGAVTGLLALAAGTRVHQRVDPVLFAQQVTTEAGFWRSFAEVLSVHPILPRRVSELSASGLIDREQLGLAIHTPVSVRALRPNAGPGARWSDGG